MKKNLLFTIIGFMLGLSVAVGATILYNAKEIEFTPSDKSWEVNNLQDAVNDIKDNYIPKSEILGRTWNFDYTGTVQTFSATYSGIYKLEIWGASGGSSSARGGYGGFSEGNILLNKDEKLYIVVGGQASSQIGGYNGGGTASGGFGGGGASHISINNNLGELKNYENNKSDILIVAGGGGGAFSSAIGGNSGGYLGLSGVGYNGGAYGTGASQSSAGLSTAGSYAGSFGLGGDACNEGAGGGGYFGGGGTCSSNGGSGGGGSSYIGNSQLTNKTMYCYNCTPSSVESIKTISNVCVNTSPSSKCSKVGNGYAKITLIAI